LSAKGVVGVVLYTTKQLIRGRIALILLDILMVGLFALFTVIVMVQLWGKTKFVKKGNRLNIVIPIALITVDMIYIRLIKKMRLKG